MRFDTINVLPALVKEVSMQEYENHLVQLTQGIGGFALVLKGEKHLIDVKSHPEKALNALFTVYMRGMVPSPLTQAAWDAIPTGVPWHDYK